jgi:hypothetical protein
MTDLLPAPTAVVDGPLFAVDALTLAAGALAVDGAIDPESIPCDVCSLPAAIHPAPVLVLADPGHPHQVPEAYALALAALAAQDRDLMDDIADGIAGEYRPSGSSTPRPSDAGACERAVWYRIAPPDDYEPRTDVDRRRAAVGTLIHAAGAKYRPALYPWRRFEMEVRVPGLARVGYVDEYDPVTGTVYDTKSAGRAKWIILATGPVPEMWEQLAIYGYALEAAGYPVRRLCIVAVNRDTGAEERHWLEYDPGFALEAIDKLNALADAITAGIVPDRAGLGPKHWRCNWCEARDHCWNTAKARELGRGPVSLTLLGEQPGEDAIVWAARQFLAVDKQVGDLEDRKKFLKELLQGLPTGPYGADRDDRGVEIVDSNSTNVGYKEAYEALLALWELPEDQRPTYANLPRPKVTKTTSQTARLPRVGETKKTRKKAPTAAEKAAAAAAAAAGQA